MPKFFHHWAMKLLMPKSPQRHSQVGVPRPLKKKTLRALRIISWTKTSPDFAGFYIGIIQNWKPKHGENVPRYLDEVISLLYKTFQLIMKVRSANVTQILKGIHKRKTQIQIGDLKGTTNSSRFLLNTRKNICHERCFGVYSYRPHGLETVKTPRHFFRCR